MAAVLADLGYIEFLGTSAEVYTLLSFRYLGSILAQISTNVHFGGSSAVFYGV